MRTSHQNADCRCAARVIGEDRERNRIAPLGGDRTCPGELEPAEVRVDEDAVEGRQVLHQPSLEAAFRGELQPLLRI